MNFGHVYHDILDNVMARGIVELNKRTGVRIKELPAGISFSLDIGLGVLPTCGLRKTKPWHAAAEAAWCLLGHDHIDWLKKHSGVWNQFVDPLNGQLPQAYGNRWRHWGEEGFDQLQTALDRLKKDSSDRRVWITSYHPIEDLVDDGQKTVPCPVGFSLSIMDGSLCSSLMIRSSDLYFGLPYDVMRHAFIMTAIATTLGIGLGHMRVTLAHPHVYMPQWSIAYEMLRQEPTCPRILMPQWSIATIFDDPDGYVELMKTRSQQKNLTWPEYDPKSEVVK